MKNIFSIKIAMKAQIKKILKTFGMEIRRISPTFPDSQECDRPERFSLAGVLQHIRSVGFSPATVIDVGAAYGLFTSTCRQYFPDSRYVLIEPLTEYTSFLQAELQTLPKSEYVNAVAADISGTMTINVHPDLVGSSLYKEEEDSNVNGTERSVPAITLNELCRDKKTTAPYLLKIDAQGAELKILAGTDEILSETEVILLETSCFQFFKGGPQLHDCLMFMKERGFVIYDIYDIQYRLLDGAMSQVDLVFVQENGIFRRFHQYATREQRDAQNLQFLK